MVMPYTSLQDNQQSHHGPPWPQGLEKSPATLRQQLVVISVLGRLEHHQTAQVLETAIYIILYIE